jgi:hypothetical protein
MPVLLFELMFAGLVLAFVFSQVLVPTWRETPMFPMFRKETDLLRKHEEKRQHELEKQLEKDLRKEDRSV